MDRQQITFSIEDEQVEYLGEWMQRVSRTFALVVPFVEEPLTHYLATAYLLCRVADNIEDCTQAVEWKQARFAELATLLSEPAQAADIVRPYAGSGATWWVEAIWKFFYSAPGDVDVVRQRIRQGPPRI